MKWNSFMKTRVFGCKEKQKSMKNQQTFQKNLGESYKKNSQLSFYQCKKSKKIKIKAIKNKSEKKIEIRITKKN